MPSFSEIKEPTQEHGLRSQCNYLMANIKPCPDCDTDEFVIVTEKKEQVCLKCGLVVDDVCLVHSYTKPQENTKTPSWRKPKYYDTKFFELLNKNYPNTTRFNYTYPGSKNHELNGYYNRYKNEDNKEELIVKDNCLEEGRVVCNCHDLETPTKYGGSRLTDYYQEYVDRQNSKGLFNWKLFGTGKIKRNKPSNDEMKSINETVRQRRTLLKERGLTL